MVRVTDEHLDTGVEKWFFNIEQNQSSAPWLRPPNTLCNTDGWRRTRKSTSKITVRSAKKQERLKKHGTQNQSATGFASRRPCSIPSWLMMSPTDNMLLCLLPGLSHLLLYPTRDHWFLKPVGDPVTPQSEVRSVEVGVEEQRSIREGLKAECAVGCRFVVLKRDMNTDMTSWLISWLQ